MILSERCRSGNSRLSGEAAEQTDFSVSAVNVENVTDHWLTVGIISLYF